MTKYNFIKTIAVSLFLALLLNIRALACDEGYIVGAKTKNCIKSTDSCGDDCTYTIDSNGNLELTGSGYIKDNVFAGNQDIINVKINYGFTEIGNGVFLWSIKYEKCGYRQFCYTFTLGFFSRYRD